MAKVLNNVYVGERYIPKVDGAWDGTKEYEGLVIVSYNNISYISRRPVPAGTQITNETYWAEFNTLPGEVQALQNQINTIQQQIDSGEIGGAGGIWTNAQDINITPGTDISSIIANLPDTVKNIGFPAGTYNISTATAFNVPIYMAPGAVFNITASVTFNKPVTAGRQQIFTVGTNGSVSYNPSIVYPEWFGWVPNVASTAANTLFASVTDAVVLFGAGTYSYSGSSPISFSHNLILRGISQDLTKIVMNMSVQTLDFLCLENVHLSAPAWTATSIQYFFCSNCLCSDLTGPAFTFDSVLEMHFNNTIFNTTSTNIFHFVNVTSCDKAIFDDCTFNGPFNETDSEGYHGVLYRNSLYNGEIVKFTDCTFTHCLWVYGTIRTGTPVNPFYLALENCTGDISYIINEVGEYVNAGVVNVVFASNCKFTNYFAAQALSGFKFANCQIEVAKITDNSYFFADVQFSNCQIIIKTDRTGVVQGFYTQCVFGLPSAGNIMFPTNTSPSHLKAGCSLISCKGVPSSLSGFPIYNSPPGVNMHTPIGSYEYAYDFIDSMHHR